MELRTTEEKINDLTSLYEAIRQSPILPPEQAALLPPLSLTSLNSIATTGNNPSISIAIDNSDKNNNDFSSSPDGIRPPSDLIGLVQAIQEMESSLVEWQAKVEKFRKRLTEVDPVTEKPRYGPIARDRVQRLVDAYDFLCQRHLPGDPSGESDLEAPATVDDATTSGGIESAILFREIKQQHTIQLEYQRRQQELHQQTQRAQEEEIRNKQEQVLAEQQALELERAARIAADQASETERLYQQAEQARRRRRAQQEAQLQSERDWLDSITKGPDGVRKYIEELKKSTADIPHAQSKALSSLFLIFDQIQKHPEEVNFRKIRLSHEGFHNDIGRHKGGIELLIAAGFRPTKLPTTSDENGGNASIGTNGGDVQEEIPTIACLISKEPNLEHDMDGWSAWYDLNKATFEILQNEVQSLKT